jgi:hypothetical protein
MPRMTGDETASATAAGDDVPGGRVINSILGEPYVRGDATVVPVSEVRVAQGANNAPARVAAHSRPVALIVFEGDKVRVEAIINITLVALAGILLAGWNVYWITRTIREWRSRV